MRILFFTQILPYPLDAGPKVRAYYVLRHLATKHEVTLVSFVRSTDTPGAISHLNDFCHAVHTVTMPRSAMLDGAHLVRSLLNGQPFLIARDRVRKMTELVSDLSGRDDSFDAVHADQLWMAPYALLAKKNMANNRACKLILDQHNAVYLIPKRLAESEQNPAKRALLRLESVKMANYEESICGDFDDVVWVTQQDREAINALSNGQHRQTDGRKTKHRIIPICCDVEGRVPIKRVAAPHRVTFLGGLHYPPNAQGILWYARFVFSRILERVPQAVLTIVGKDPPKELSDLGIPSSNLEVPGYVDKPERYMAETAAFVVPIQSGGGMRVKILDGWTWGVPIVSTSIGAEGIDVRHGDNILIADAPESLIDCTVRLLDDQAFRNRIGLMGRKTVESMYNWRSIYRKWDEIYHK